MVIVTISSTTAGLVFSPRFDTTTIPALLSIEIYKERCSVSGLKLGRRVFFRCFWGDVAGIYSDIHCMVLLEPADVHLY